MQIVHATSPQQLLLALPHLAGPAIARSVVLVPFHGTRTGMALRCDLPTLDRSRLPEWADLVLDAVCSAAPTAIAYAIVTDERVGAGALPHRAIARALTAAARRARVPVRARLCQASDAWGDYEHPEGPRGPLAELEVTDGLPFLAPVAPPSVPSPAPRAQRDAVVDRLDRMDDDDLAAAFDDPVVTIELALHAAVLAPTDAAILLRLLQSPAIRDVATCQLLDGMAAGAAALALQRGEAVEADPATRLLGVGTAPAHDRVELGIGLVERLVALAPEPMLPAPLTVLASLHWLLGRSGTASLCVERALRIEPGHGMALLLATVLHAGLLPEWVEADRAQRATA